MGVYKLPKRLFLGIAYSIFITGNGTLFDYDVVPTRQNFSESEILCQYKGYDGLAVVNSPEMHAYALQITKSLRELSTGLYIGLRNDSYTHPATWDDKTVIAPDLPWTSAKAADFSERPFGRIHHFGSFMSGSGYAAKWALCGNHTNLPTEAYGVSSPGQQAAGLGSNLSQTRVFSYLECVLLCGQDPWCRAAQFNSDLLTCITLAVGSYNTGFTAHSKSQVFVRNGFIV